MSESDFPFELNVELRTELNRLMLPFVDQPINSQMMLAMHIKLYTFALKRFPELTPKEINDQVRVLITELVNHHRKGC